MACANASAATYPADFQERTLADGIDAPTGMAWERGASGAPLANGRMFIITKPGDLRVKMPGQTSSQVILSIRDHVNNYGDRGLLGIAVDRDFATNRFVYLLYTREVGSMMADGDGPMVSQLRRVVVNPDNSIGAQEVILGTYDGGPCPPGRNDLDCIPSDGASHSIGSVRADTDGTLWVGSGDSASYGGIDPKAFRTYDEQSLSGKLLHITRDGEAVGGHPFCPAASVDNVCAKVWAKGFRNPYRFQLRPGGRGLFVGDVGWNEKEEIDLVPTAAGTGGRNYGWPCYEGDQRTPGYRDDPLCSGMYAQPSAHTAPDHWYYHAGVGDPPAGAEIGNTVIGGPTYESGAYPAGYAGSAFYADYTAQTIRRMTFDSQGRKASTVAFATGVPGMVDLALTPAGNLAVLDFGTFNDDGSIKEIVYDPDNQQPVARATATPSQGAVPLNVAFDATQSSDPDGNTPLSYDWDFGDGSAHGTGATPSHTYTQPGTYTTKLTVTDARGGTDTWTTTVRAGGPPVATIQSPASESTYQGGTPVQLSGTATDPDGPLADSALSWRVVLHHGVHTHPLDDVLSGPAVSFTPVRDHDADSYYEVTLTATDPTGLKDTKTILLRPQVAPVRLRSVPAGAPVSYGGRSLTAPFSGTTAVGFQTTLSAAASFDAGGKTWAFEGWSDGGPRVQSDLIVPPAGIDLVATYRDTTPPPASQPETPDAEEPAVPKPDAPATPEKRRPAPAPKKPGFASSVSKTKGLLSYFGLGDASGPARTAKGSTRGRYVGRPARARALASNGTDGRARAFDGRNDHVVINSRALGSSKQFTVEGWIRLARGRAAMNTTVLSNALREASDGLTLRIDGRGRPVVKLFARTGHWASTRGPALGTRVRHFAITYSGSWLRIYVDGEQTGRVRHPHGAFWRPGRRLILGADQRLRRPFAGVLDEVALYSRALSARTIKAHRTAGR